MNPEKVYACYNNDKAARLSSSSGAVFSSLAEYVFDKNGIVYGVAMSEDCYSAEFIAVMDQEGLIKLRGSKYLQAKVGDTFKKVKSDLQSGKWVLFTGTGCQVNGLKKFLGKNYENLITVDVICHGAPSPALWRKYAEYREEKYGGKLKYINFRCKNVSWADFGMKEVLNNTSQKSEQELYISKANDPYMQMFLRDYCLRPSCYECAAKNAKMSDLTIADFWGIKSVAPEMNDGLGTSLVLVRTDKGKQVFNAVSKKMRIKEVSYKDGVRFNPAEYKSCVRPFQRDNFFIDMNSISFENLERIYAAPLRQPFIILVKRKIKDLIKSILQIIGGGQKVIPEMDYCMHLIFDIERKN